MMPTEDGPTFDPVDLQAVEDALDKAAAERLIKSETFGRFCENANYHSLAGFLEEYDPAEWRVSSD